MSRVSPSEDDRVARVLCSVCPKLFTVGKKADQKPGFESRNRNCLVKVIRSRGPGVLLRVEHETDERHNPLPLTAQSDLVGKEILGFSNGLTGSDGGLMGLDGVQAHAEVHPNPLMDPGQELKLCACLR